MRRLTSTIAVLCVLTAIAIGSPLAAAGGRGKTAVRIDVAGSPQGGNRDSGGGRFALHTGAGDDSGAAYYSVTFGRSGKTPAGEPYATFKSRVTLVGKDGGLVVLLRGKGFGANGDGVVGGRDVWTGTWSITSGDGAYAGVHGSGDFVGIAGPSAKVALRLQGRVG